MKFVEEAESAFSAAQLAAAERELEEQKKEWELDRLRALREEEERRMRLADDDEKPLTFGREDAQNQVNSTATKGGNSKRLVSKRLAIPSRRSLRRRGGNRVGRARLESSSESENETTSTESDSESQEEDIVEDSLDEESSHTESQSQGDEEEEGEGNGGGEKEEKDDEEEEAGEESEDGRANDRDYSERRGGFSRRKGRLAGSGSYSRNHFDLNSPRTRSRGNVQINLWTLDVSPILPGVKPNCRRQRKKFHRVKSEETLFSPSSNACPKRSVRINMNAKIQSTNSCQNAKISEDAEVEGDSTRNNADSINSSSVEQQTANSNVQRPPDDHIDPITSVKTQSEQTRTSELNSDNAEKGIKEKNDEKIVNGTNLITVCSVQVTRCSQKMLSSTHRKLEPEVNRNEDAENVNVNVSARDSRASPIATQPDASLKRSKESIKSKSEFGASANSLSNNARGKLVAATSRESGNVESSSRSVPLLRSKTLRNASPDTVVDKIPKSVAISRVSIAQRNCKTNADDSRSNLIEDEDKNGTCDDTNDNAESIVSSTRKYTSQRHNSKSDTRENLNVASSQETEKGTGDPVSNASDSLVTSSIKNETNSNEYKYKIRRLEVTIPRSVITRSSKIPSVTSNHSEESNVRLTDDKVDKVDSSLEIKSGSQTKTSQGTRKIDSTDSQHSVVEQSRITRSIAAPSTPPPLTSGDEMTSSKLVPKRRPDTPLPRSVRRSAIIGNTPVKVSPTRGEKYVTRNSKQCQDNGLMNPMIFRRSRSIPPMKPDSKETVVVSARTRRPDTPRPNVPNYNNEPVSRVTRSGLTLNSSASSAKSASSPLFPPPASALKTSVKQSSRISPTSSENETPTSLASSSNEKPQRTAKVVAILTMDTRNHNSNKTFLSNQPKSAANCETKGQDKEFLVPRLSLRNQEIDREESDLSDAKSRRLRRETKRAKSATSCSQENEEANSDDDSDREPMQKRTFRSHLSPSSSSSTVTTTRSDKLRNATIS